MHCQACGNHNPVGSVYCQQCGSRLPAENPAPAGVLGPAGVPGAADAIASVDPSVRHCPRCSASNQGEVRFCVECGFAFAEAAGASFDPGPPPASAPLSSAGAAPIAPAAPVAVGAASGPQPADQAAGSVRPGPVASASGAVVPPRAPATPAYAGQGTTMGTYDPAGPNGAATTQAAPARIVAILKDGSDGRVFPLLSDVTDVGRAEGDVILPEDPYLSPRHARLRRRGDDWVIRDLDSLNGVYARIREPVDLVDGDMLLIGQQVLRFETLSDGELPLGPAQIHGVLTFGTPEVSRIARLVQYTTEGVGRDVHYLYRDETVIGRENGDVVFTDDPFLSRRHAVITIDRAAGRFALKDLGSSNGTAIRFRGERILGSGDQFRIGRHLFRFERTGGMNDR